MIRSRRCWSRSRRTRASSNSCAPRSCFCDAMAISPSIRGRSSFATWPRHRAGGNRAPSHAKQSPDDRDQCAAKHEDYLPPKPTDGCPKPVVSAAAPAAPAGLIALLGFGMLGLVTWPSRERLSGTRLDSYSLTQGPDLRAIGEIGGGVRSNAKACITCPPAFRLGPHHMRRERACVWKPDGV